MNESPPVRCLPLTCLFLSAAWSSAAAAAEIEVWLADGREWRGTIDRRSDESRLWLRLASDSTVLLRGADWRDVAGAVVDGKVTDLRTLRTRIKDMVHRPGFRRHAPADAPVSPGESFAAQAWWALAPAQPSRSPRTGELRP